MTGLSKFATGSSIMVLSALAAVPSYAAVQEVAQQAPAGTATTPSTTSEQSLEAAPINGDIVVTARRKAENIEKVPVSVTALGSDQLRSAGVSDLQDIASVVPGLNLFYVGNVHNPVYSIRGMSRGSLGFQQPAVTTYVNEVPTTLYDSALPTYDVSSIQVLKGPQGTLFGRNSEAGAMLVTTTQPTYDFNGYVDGTLGSYSWRKIDSAINIPLINDRLAVRIASEVNRRDGYTKNVSFPGHDFNNIHDDSVRASVLAEPVDGLKNVLVFEKTYSHANNVDPTLLTYDPNAQGLPNVVPGAFGIGDAYQRQVANGPRTALAPFLIPETFRGTTVTNTTTLDVGSATIKNIFGYRQTTVRNFINQSGYDFPLITGYTDARYKQTTDELQISGKTLDGNLNYIFGGFYLNYSPNGDNFIIVAPPGTGAGTGSSATLLNTPLGSDDYYQDISKSLYGQVNYSLSGISAALKGVSIDAGLRYSRDIHKLCAVSNTAAVDQLSEAECRTGPDNNSRVAQGQWSYTIGLNYQVNNDVMLYAVTRRGYRAGGLNSPTFGGTLAPFQSYQPETVHDVELGLKSSLNINRVPVIFNVALFQGNYNNLQAAINTNGINAVLNAPPFSGGVDDDGNDGNNPTIFYANVGDGRVRGVEAALTVRPVSALQIGGSLSYLDKKLTTNTFQPPANWPSFLVPSEIEFCLDHLLWCPQLLVYRQHRFDAPGSRRLGRSGRSREREWLQHDQI